MAMRSGAMAHNPEEISTTHSTGMRLTKTPVERFSRAPTMREGRMRSDAPSAELPWTSWKLGGVSDDLSQHGA